MTRLRTQAVRLIRSGSKETGWYGMYRGIVESIDDPDRLDRVLVRVWAVHGDDRTTPTSSLPWAEIEEDGGGGYDYGSFDPPPVGSGVWIQFEEGHKDYPVITGTFRGAPVRDSDNPNVFLTKDNKPDVETTWKPPDGEIETPKDVFDGVYAGDPHPTRRVWKKSFKGHTILIEEGDGKEFLRIIDRAGQVIELDCPVDPQYSRGNAAQRGLRNSIRGDQLSHSIMRHRRAAIRIKDLSGQELLFDAQDQNERVILKSRSRDGSIENTITLKSGKGKSSIEIEDSGGNSLRFDPQSETPIVIRDSANNAIIFDKANGRVRINSAKGIDEQAPQKTTTIGGTKQSKIEGDEVKEVQGNKKVRVINDANIGVLGNVLATLGGALKLVLANTSPNGSESVALDIQIANAGAAGAFHLSNLNGDMTIDTKVGDVELSTIVGNAILKTLSAGDANVDATTGKVFLGNELLPIAQGSQEPLVKGTTHNQLLSTHLTTVSAARKAWQIQAAALAGVLATALTLNLIPVVGNTLFSILMTPVWVPYQAAVSAQLAIMYAADDALIAALVSMLSTKTFTQ